MKTPVHGGLSLAKQVFLKDFIEKYSRINALGH